MKDNINPMNEAVNEPEAPDTAAPKDPPRGKAAVKAHLESKYTPEQIEQQRIMWELRSTFQSIGPAALEEMQRRAVRAARLADGNENDPDYDPALDPASPAFDILKWKQRNGINSLDELATMLVFALGNIQAQLEATTLRPGPASKEAIEAIRELKKIIDSDEFQLLKERVLSLSEPDGSNPEPNKIETPRLQSIIPSQHVMPNNALMNDLAGATGKQPINAGAYDLPVIPATKRQREITTFVMVNYEQEEGVSSLSEYERAVSDAIMSIHEQATKDGKDTVFTVDTLYRAMPGRGERAGPQQSELIEAAVNKFLHLFMEVDATEEAQKYKWIKKGETYHIKGRYIDAEEHIYTAQGGQKVKAWKLAGMPLILRYAKMTGQILTAPPQLLSIEVVKGGRASGEILKMSAQRQAMTNYMLRRIRIMQSDLKRAIEDLRIYNRRRKKDKTLEERPLESFRKQSDTILFSTLFKVTGSESESRELTRKNRDFCFSVLDYWKVSGLIRDYHKQTKGKAITGIIIMH